MHTASAIKPNVGELSDAGKSRLLSIRGEPLFIAAWDRVLMIHFEVDADVLQRAVPYQLDLRDGSAFVSLVAFTMRGMKPRWGEKFSAWLLKPIATHDFLNVRTYVRQGNEPGIHFLAEWLSNKLAVRLGPIAFGLPYRHGKIHYNHDWRNASLHGQVKDAKIAATFDYSASLFPANPFEPCEAGSLCEWLMERYTAFNSAGGRKKFFRVWHPPWQQCPAQIQSCNLSWIERTWPWFADAHLVGANFSPGLSEVWMGRPHRVTE